MPWNPTLTTLRNRLAALFPNANDARRVVEEAGIDPAYISFDAKAINNWHSILGQAELRGKVEAIVIAALQQDHHGDQPLIDAFTAYMAVLKQPVNLPAELLEPPRESPISSPRTDGNGQPSRDGTTQINTGGGTYIAGNVNTGGGDFIGRDRVDRGSNSAGRKSNDSVAPRPSRLAALKRQQLETQLDDLTRQWQAVNEELRTTNDVVTRDRLELQRSRLETAITQAEEELDGLH